MGIYTMPFGKYRSCPLPDLPEDYLGWLATLDLREPLRSAVAEDLARRRGESPDPCIVEDLIAAGQRALARRHHPDVGGNHEAMLRVRVAADWLLSHAARLRGLAA
jgi:hypothetical protein